MQKAEAAIVKAKTHAQREKALARRTKAKAELSEAESEVGWLSQCRGLRMKLFDGSSARDYEMLWQSKRFTADAALRQKGATDGTASVDVSRADRLGRAAADAAPTARVNVIGLLDLKEWNGRLQAPRRELERIARVERSAELDEKTRRERVEKLRKRLNWLVTFSARLQPSGPWIKFLDSLPPSHRYDFKKKRLYCQENKGRKGRAFIALSRLPGLRVLSVDLGHRYAAACAVWQVLTKEQVEAACAKAGREPPRADELYIHLNYETAKLQKTGKRKGKPVVETTVYRRIGADVLANGTPHPSPWARLERQFVVKLQGEDGPARKASPNEIREVDELERAVGFSRQSNRRCGEKRANQLMYDALRIARLALKRHGRRARIANRLTATSVPTVGGAMRPLDRPGLIDSLVDTLVDWYELAFGDRWIDPGARDLWNKYIRPMVTEAEPLPFPDEDLSAPARRKQRESLEKMLRPVADALSMQDRTKMQIAWVTRWRADDAAWETSLKWLKSWVAPKTKEVGAAARRVGGLSLTRIGNLRALYQLQKAHRMRPLPEDVTANVPEKGEDTLRDFAKRSLIAMERLRENRIKQLASRLVEAALGVGREPGRAGKRELRRAQQRIDEPCHVVVIENLTHYRPEETRVRRENRQLMSWSAANVKKYLADACELHGLHLIEISPAFTSRQDSRTGAPGVRCIDVSARMFLESKKWQSEVARARARVKVGGQDARDLFIVELAHALEKSPQREVRVRLPQRGGELFVSADRESPTARGVQADLNAAANIGLKALLDPDWPGAWWNVPCDSKTYEPWSKSTSGSAVFDGVGALAQPPSEEKLGRGRRRGRARSGDSDRPVYLWRDVSARPILDARWRGYQEYHNGVQCRVVQVLREQAGLEGASPVDDSEDVPF
ncbi:MAG TPA: type V CRISPR-associated protein Cas12b [Pirellulales bacterium]|nr:type V CRISPR-associated protein Cas12b [Pirellulales bacterium]